jgi:general secretion pathway protein K
MRTPAPQHHAGIALIIVMISITVLSILAAGFAYSMKVETKLAMNANSDTELTWLGLSGVELARYVLAQTLKCPYDSLNQKWAGGPGSDCETNAATAGISLEKYELGSGRFSVKITDLERKVNINGADEATLEQGLRLVGVDAGDFSAIGGSILDWIDADNNIHIGGTESDYYQTLDPPYYAKNKPIDDLSELLLVRGITPDIYWGGISTNHPPAAFQNRLGVVRPGSAIAYPVGLADLFTPISSGRININTASFMTLQMIPSVDENIASEIIRLRSGPDGADGTEDDTPFHNPGELVNAGLSRQVVQQLSRFCDVRSRTFEVEVDAEVGSYKRKFFAILGRNSPRDVQILSFYWK